MIRRLTTGPRVGLGGLVVLVLGALVADDVVITGEVALSEVLNDVPGTLIDGLAVVTQLGTPAAIVLVAIVAAVLVDRRRLRVVLTVLLAGGLAWVGATLVEEVVERPSPAAAGAAVERHDGADGSGYPSAHVSVATGALAGAALATRRHPSAAFAAGAVVGVSRVAVGANLALDVVGGLAMGAVAAALAVALADR